MLKRTLSLAFEGQMEFVKQKPTWTDPCDEIVVDAMKKFVEVMQQAKSDF